MICWVLGNGAPPYSNVIPQESQTKEKRNKESQVQEDGAFDLTVYTILRGGSQTREERNKELQVLEDGAFDLTVAAILRGGSQTRKEISKELHVLGKGAFTFGFHDYQSAASERT